MNITKEELLTFNGKAWGQMDNAERHALWTSDEDLARAMKEQHDERPWVGKAFGELTMGEKHALANARPRLYQQLRDEHEELGS